jgi:hypothetical protein
MCWLPCIYTLRWLDILIHTRGAPERQEPRLFRVAVLAETNKNRHGWNQNSVIFRETEHQVYLLNSIELIRTTQGKSTQGKSTQGILTLDYDV